MEKSIKLGEKFDSFDEFDRLFKTYCNQTHQNFLKRSSRFLKIEDIRTIEERELKKSMIIFKDIMFDCVHKGESRKNPEKKGEKENVSSKKIDCSAHLRVNFDLKSQTFFISKLENKHNHPLNANIYQQYSNVRKPAENEINEMVQLINDFGANPSKIVRNYNYINDKALRTKDIWNQKSKLDKQSKTSELNKLDEILDKLSQNPNNTITTKKSDDGLLENAFIMTEEQKNGSTGTPKLFILMELLEPMILNTVNLSFLAENVP